MYNIKSKISINQKQNKRVIDVRDLTKRRGAIISRSVLCFESQIISFRITSLRWSIHMGRLRLNTANCHDCRWCYQTNIRWRHLRGVRAWWFGRVRGRVTGRFVWGRTIWFHTRWGWNVSISGGFARSDGWCTTRCSCRAFGMLLYRGKTMFRKISMAVIIKWMIWTQEYIVRCLYIRIDRPG